MDLMDHTDAEPSNESWDTDGKPAGGSPKDPWAAWCATSNEGEQPVDFGFLLDTPRESSKDLGAAWEAASAEGEWPVDFSFLLGNFGAGQSRSRSGIKGDVKEAGDRCFGKRREDIKPQCAQNGPQQSAAPISPSRFGMQSSTESLSQARCIPQSSRKQARAHTCSLSPPKQSKRLQRDDKPSKMRPFSDDSLPVIP